MIHADRISELLALCDPNESNLIFRPYQTLNSQSIALLICRDLLIKISYSEFYVHISLIITDIIIMLIMKF